jgi:hypothetical protein
MMKQLVIHSKGNKSSFEGNVLCSQEKGRRQRVYKQKCGRHQKMGLKRTMDEEEKKVKRVEEGSQRRQHSR